MAKYELFKMRCEKCSYEWEKIAKSTTGDRFVFTSRKKYIPVILMFESIFFNEVLTLIKKNLQNSTLSKNEMADRFQEMLGQVSDPAPDGTHFSMMADYICPKCGSGEVDFGPKNPPEARVEDLPELPHEYWDSLNEKDKKELVRKHLKNT
ncbi:MAG: hypothetical protein A4E56_03457 [Pelotomaculum sp. PtaU1.Bin065]|nr:MAG: hypothetical protein A4E56_03457 [Pelotomaculum sp. PtaU1.Bin065]